MDRITREQVVRIVINVGWINVHPAVKLNANEIECKIYIHRSIRGDEKRAHSFTSRLQPQLVVVNQSPAVGRYIVHNHYTPASTINAS